MSLPIGRCCIYRLVSRQDRRFDEYAKQASAEKGIWISYEGHTVSSDTRDKFLNAAERLFAEKGFYGVSIAAIAEELGLTKQALIHHFGTKEKLYGEVLGRISNQLITKLEFNDLKREAAANVLEKHLLNSLSGSVIHYQHSQLLMREMLDNRRRAPHAESWYLKPYLQKLADVVCALPGWEKVDEETALAGVYQLLGAINYFAVSEPTLSQMFGADYYERVVSEFPQALQRLIRSFIASPPP